MTVNIVEKGPDNRYTVRRGVDGEGSPQGTWGVRLDMHRPSAQQVSGSTALAGAEVQPPVQQPEAQQN